MKTLFTCLIVGVLLFTVSLSWSHELCSRFDDLVKPCWPENANVKCNWCTVECIPDVKLFVDSNFTRFEKPEDCCRFECGTYRIEPGKAVQGESFTRINSLLLVYLYFNIILASLKKILLRSEV